MRYAFWLPDLESYTGWWNRDQIDYPTGTRATTDQETRFTGSTIWNEGLLPGNIQDAGTGFTIFWTLKRLIVALRLAAYGQRGIGPGLSFLSNA